MSPASSTILPDTRALRQVFDADFQTLVAQARTHLGDAASLAPRVAEGALVRAWDARGRLQTKQQLDTYLADDVKAAAARALSRRAASQKAAAAAGHTPVSTPTEAPQIDLAQSWAYILDAIHIDPHTANEQKVAAEVARHEAASAVTTATSSGFSTATLAIVGVVIVAAAIIAVHLITTLSTEKTIAEAVVSPSGHVTASGYGQMANVQLPDDGKVKLAPDSKLLVPANFGGKIRVVKLDGAASFQVASGQPGDFRVYLRNAILTTTDAAFTVSAYGTDSTEIVKVTSGSLDLKTGTSVKTLGAGQSDLVDSAGTERQPSADEVDQATGWTTGTLTVSHQSLNAALMEIQRWYGVAINVQDLRLLDRSVTFRTPLDSSTVAIQALQKASGLQLVHQGNINILQDAGSGRGK